MSFANREFEELDEKWSAYRGRIFEVEDNAEYQALLAETWPLLYEAWMKDGETVSKDAARLLCTMGNLFGRVFDDDGNCLAAECIEVASEFHCDFLNALIYHDTLKIDGEGRRVIPTGEKSVWVVDPETFELPEEWPGYAELDD